MAAGAGARREPLAPLAAPGTTGTGGTGAGACVKGQTHGKDVAILGESFIALSTIPTELETLAKAAGSLPSGEKYVNNAVSGTTIAGANGNVDQYNKAVASSGTIKYVIMDGGGNDCLQANNPSASLVGRRQTVHVDGFEKYGEGCLLLLSRSHRVAVSRRSRRASIRCDR